MLNWILVDLEIAESGTRALAIPVMLAWGEVRGGRKLSGRSGAFPRSSQIDVWNHQVSLNTTETHPRPDRARQELSVLRRPGFEDLAMHCV